MAHFVRTAALGLAVALVACAPPGPAGPAPAVDQPGAPREGTRQLRTLVVGITSNVEAFSIAGGTTTAGGWMSANEIHSEALITADAQSRKPVGRLAERAPTFEDGSMSLLDDGRMRVVYRLRPGITWHDGAPLSARDLVFSHQVGSDPGLPAVNRDAVREMDSTDAPDDSTFVILFRRPFYLADSLGIRMFWPLPRHLLQEAYDQYTADKNAEAFLNLPYWTSAYVHLGPFRVTAFEPGEGVAFQAYDRYFLGRPKIDTLRIRTFGNANALFSNILAGSVDLFMDLSLNAELGFQLAERWRASGDGSVRLLSGYVRFLMPQWRPSFQREPGNLDVRVRAALYQAIDRAALTEALQSGHRELAAHAILPPDNRNFEGARDALRRYSYDPDRARALLREAGWTPGGDGVVRGAVDGRRFHTTLWSTSGSDQEIAAIADYWRRVGIDVEEFIVPAAFTRNNEYRASYPGWETTANYADAILGRLRSPAGPETRWAGGNRAGYDDPRAVRLVEEYFQSLSEADQRRAIRAISDFVAAELPFMPLFCEADHIGARKGVRALDDVAGGAGAGAPYGYYSRSAHLWEIE